LLEGNMKHSMALISVITLAAAFSVTQSPARAQVGAAPIAGAWMLNTDLTDKPDQSTTQPDGGERGSGGGYGRGGGGGYGRRGGRGGGIGGYGGGGGRQAGAGPTGSPEERERMRQAMRDIMDAPSRLTITQTNSMVTIVTGDGRTTRLAPTGKGIKDESTKIERKTKWDNGKLVSEISGVGRGKITETYALDPANHRLTITLQMDSPRGPRVIHHVYDAQPL
jgi:hypothetical protein